MAEPTPQEISIPLVWLGAEEVPILFANQFMGQVDDHGEAIITVGQVTPPAILGTPEQQAEQIQNVAFVPVKPIARIALGTERLRELVAVLQQTLENQARVRQMRAQQSTSEGASE